MYIFYESIKNGVREQKKTLTEIIRNNKKELTMKERKKTLGYNKPKQT